MTIVALRALGGMEFTVQGNLALGSAREYHIFSGGRRKGAAGECDGDQNGEQGTNRFHFFVSKKVDTGLLLVTLPEEFRRFLIFVNSLVSLGNSVSGLKARKLYPDPRARPVGGRVS